MMNTEILILYILYFFIIVTLLFGIFSITFAILNPKKIMFKKLKVEDSLNKEKNIQSNKFLLIIVGSICLLLSLFLWLST